MFVCEIVCVCVVGCGAYVKVREHQRAVALDLNKVALLILSQRRAVHTLDCVHVSSEAFVLFFFFLLRCVFINISSVRCVDMPGYRSTNEA